MPVTLEQVQGFLDEFDLNYHVDEERSAILISFAATVYPSLQAAKLEPVAALRYE